MCRSAPYWTFPRTSKITSKHLKGLPSKFVGRKTRNKGLWPKQKEAVNFRTHENRQMTASDDGQQPAVWLVDWGHLLLFHPRVSCGHGQQESTSLPEMFSIMFVHTKQRNMSYCQLQWIDWKKWKIKIKLVLVIENDIVLCSKCIYCTDCHEELNWNTRKKSTMHQQMTVSPATLVSSWIAILKIYFIIK